ncbi:hypothetical protein QUC31_017092 [Theobroma cacao]
MLEAESLAKVLPGVETIDEAPVSTVNSLQSSFCGNGGHNLTPVVLYIVV